MKLFPWQKEAEFFDSVEKETILQAIQKAEQRTSGEIRLYVESRCRFVNPLDRAQELFFSLKMDHTELKNGVLIYLATKDHQAAILGDTGIHQKVGIQFWEEELNKMMVCFKQEHLAEGICQVIGDLGEVLYQHFPYDKDTDKNELPDDIIFGK